MRLTRGPICLTDQGYPNMHMDIHDLRREYDYMRWEEYRVIRNKFDKTWYYHKWKSKILRSIMNFILIIWFIIQVLVVGVGGMALGLWLTYEEGYIMMIGGIPGGILLMGGIFKYILYPIYDFFAGLTKFRLRWTLMCLGYSPFYVSWNFKQWYKHNYKYYEGFIPYPHPSNVGWIRSEIDVFFRNWEH